MSKASEEIRRLAMVYLARREYGAQELVEKLVSKGFGRDDVMRELAVLQERGWQSDQRFAESLLRSRLGTGYGPYRIERELLAKGLDRDLVCTLLYNGDIDWVKQVRYSWTRRFGNGASSDATSRQKQQNFLLYKGFSLEQVKEALDG